MFLDFCLLDSSQVDKLQDGAVAGPQFGLATKWRLQNKLSDLFLKTQST